MQFVQGLPEGVCVGQTRVHHEKIQPSAQPELAGFNLALHVGDDAKRVQQHRMALLAEFAEFGVNKVTWMTQTHSTICHTINEEIPFQALEGDGVVTQRKAHALMMMTADCLPVVLGNADGTEIANLHAGWRGCGEVRVCRYDIRINLCPPLHMGASVCGRRRHRPDHSGRGPRPHCR